MKKEKVMKKIKFRKVENPMETVTVNGVEIVPDEVFEVKLPKNTNKVMVGGNWPKGDN
jgi:DNA repair protein RadC